MNEGFDRALGQVLAGEKDRGIGTLGEKTVHAVLKNYFQPDSESHEVKIGSYYADVVGEDGIFEIQTGSFDRLRKKLTELLAVTRVTVVYPVSRHKTICRLDPLTGEILSKRKSPLTGSFYQVFPELYKIKSQLCKPNFSLCLVLLDVCEYRTGAGRKTVKADRVPTALLEEVYFFSPQDYGYFLPQGLKEPFTCDDFAAVCGTRRPVAGSAVNVLAHLGLLTPAGRLGNKKLYTRTKEKTTE